MENDDELYYKKFLRALKDFDFYCQHKKYKKHPLTNLGELPNCIFWSISDEQKHSLKFILCDYYWNYVVLKDTPYYDASLTKDLRKCFYGKKMTNFLKHTDKYFNNLSDLFKYIENLPKN